MALFGKKRKKLSRRSLVAAAERLTVSAVSKSSVLDAKPAISFMTIP